MYSIDDLYNRKSIMNKIVYDLDYLSSFFLLLQEFEKNYDVVVIISF